MLFSSLTVGGQSAITINGQTSGNALIIDNFDGTSVVDSNTGVTTPFGVEFCKWNCIPRIDT